MPNVLKERGAKSKANLKRGGSPGRYAKGTKLTAEQKAQEKAVRAISRKLLSDPQYVKRLKERLREGTIQPGVEAMLWYYAHGKPQETIENKTPIPISIKHTYAE